MPNAITVTSKTGNVVTFSLASDPRITAITPKAMMVFCKSDRAAREMSLEARAWGITSIMFDGPAAREVMGA